MASPRWLADEMVGRLARYLRFSGCDTVYAKGLSDDEILRLARTEDRVVLTRDRLLARRAPSALLLESPDLKQQWLAVARSYPELPRDVAFTRCSLCNGELRSWSPGSEDRTDPSVPWSRVDRGLPLFRCDGCGHVFWEGSHTETVRARLRAWSQELVP